MDQHINIIFDGPPGPEAGRFVEVENDGGFSINVGEWIERPDGLWALRLRCNTTPTTEIAELKADNETLKKKAHEFAQIIASLRVERLELKAENAELESSLEAALESINHYNAQSTEQLVEKETIIKKLKAENAEIKTELNWSKKEKELLELSIQQNQDYYKAEIAELSQALRKQTNATVECLNIIAQLRAELDCVYLVGTSSTIEKED